VKRRENAYRKRRAQLRIGNRFDKEEVETMSVAFAREESAETAAEVELPDGNSEGRRGAGPRRLT